MKRILRLLTTATIMIGTAVPAVAQLYPGQDVIVDPAAIPHGPLLQPGQPYPGLHLTPPSAHRHYRHRHVAKAAAPVDTTTAATTDQTAAPAPDTTAPAKPDRHHRETAAAAAPADTGPANPIPFTFGGDNTEPPPAAPPPAKVAKTEPPPAHASHGASQSATLAKRGAILFAHDSTNPAPSQMDPIKLLAGDLNSAIQAGATGIQLQAYGGAPGDKSSDARRISLKRALAIRQILIDNGVPADRIDVRAMGGATDKGEPDRVDIFVRAS